MHTLQPLHDTELATAYTVKELHADKPTAFDKALGKWNEHNYVELDAECHLDYYDTEILRPQGYDIHTNKGDTSWSIGGYRGDDYFVFQATVNVRQWLKYHKLSNKYRSLINYCIATGCDAWVYIKRENSYYNRANSYSEAEIEYQWGVRDPSRNAENELTTIEYLIHEQAKYYMHKIECDLRADYEYQYSAENFIEMCEANDHLFDEDGNII